jgi:hypothetical protein
VSAAVSIPPPPLRDDPESIELICEELVLAAEEARDDPIKFFEFVMRDEETNSPIRVAPHQALIIEWQRSHAQSVTLLPIGHGKTYTTAALALYELGEDPMMRAALVSLAQGQAEKPVGMIRQYIETSPELQLVFPKLRKTQRGGEPWTTTDITVDRPPGIRDPSMVARGLDSQRVLGSRWKRLAVDDLLDGENTRTPEGRQKVWEHFAKKLRTRVDPREGRINATGTAWHPDDTLHRLMNPRPIGAGWPALVMRADGTILILNDPQWDSPLIRPADDRLPNDPMAEYRLVAHDPDPDCLVTLWPERWPRAKLEAERAELPAAYFNQIYLNICRDDTTSLCKQDDIERGKELARKLGVHAFVPRIPPGNDKGWLVFTGVDLAFSKAASADECAIFTFAVVPETKHRIPLWIDYGKWGTAELAQRIVDHNDRYHPAGISFESNAAQEGVRQMIVDKHKGLPLKPYVTNASKHRIEFGVPVIFTEFANGAWAIPNGKDGSVNPTVKKWLDQCLYYVPSEHTGDILMAQFFALQLAKRYGALAKIPPGAAQTRIAANIMSR